MLRQNKFLILAFFAVCFFMSGCKTIEGPRLALFSGHHFNRDLARGYAMLAEYEKFLQDDEATAAYFLDKAEDARTGQGAEPGSVEGKPLSPAEAAHLAEARAMLVQGLENRHRVGNISALAEAQLNYECWLMRAARDHPTAGYCRESFYETIRNIDVQEQKPRTFSIHFDSGKAIPDSEGMEIIKQAAYAHTMNETWPVYLVGYTDSVGDPASNRILSMRRSISVRNALAQYGVNMDMVEIEAVGEVDRSGSDAESRRVDIRIEPAYGHQPATTLEPEDILPHSF